MKTEQKFGLVLLAFVLLSMATTGIAKGASTNTGWHRVGVAQRAQADRAARMALRGADASLRRCIGRGYRIYMPGSFVGRECVIRSGVTGQGRWGFAGMVWRHDANGTATFLIHGRD